MKGKYIVIGSIVLICGIIAYRLISNKKQLDSKKNQTTVVDVNIPVKVALVKDSILELSVNKTGTIIPFKEAKVIAPVSGTLKNIRFSLGTPVSKGQVLAIVDNRSEQLDLQKAERNAAKLKADLQTYKELLAGKATTREKVDEMNANYQDAITQMNVIKKNISDAIVKAPATGMVTLKQVEAGMFVNAGNEIATIVDISKTKAQVFLSENEVYQVKNGQSVEITADIYPNAIFEGTVDFISPQADETRSYQTEVLINNKTYTLLRSGTYVNLKFLGVAKERALLIPREAISGSIKDPAVFVIEGGKAKRRKVKVGKETGGLIQILGGLAPNDKVVVSGQINLKSGSKVKISQ